MKNMKKAMIGLISAAIFSLLCLIGVFSSLEDRLYDFFLSFRANRERINNVVFLDVDDQAIAYYGFFPWPRSITAEGLLRLKEYGTRAVIFDIEYIDRGPQGVDSVYLEQGLGYDFDRSFSEIDVTAQEIFSALRTGRIRNTDISLYAESLSEVISRERSDLYGRSRNVARDNDLYLAQAMALNGNSWSTINLWAYPLEGEQAQRRVIAKERFSYPVNAAPNASRGEGIAVDILPALSIFSEAAKGAGYTNVVIDEDGIRRRIYLTQNVFDHWYLQLSFAPLIYSLGNPEIILEKRKLTIKNAQVAQGKTKDIVIPLDSKGRMMLDWPKTEYNESYAHISFAEFNLLDEMETEIARYSHALSAADIDLFARFDDALSSIPVVLGDITQLLDASQAARVQAIHHTSEDLFRDFVEYRNAAYGLLGGLLADEPAAKIFAIAARLSEEHPELAEEIEDEAGYIASLLNALEINLSVYNEKTGFNKNLLNDKFVIIGRVDTGTTDYGANPFYGKYINVGTHGVVLDTILSETFIVPVDFWFNIVFMLIFIPVFFMATAHFAPVVRASIGFSAALLFFIITILLFRFTGFFWGPLGTILAMISAIIVREIISYSHSEKEKQFIRAAFSTYVSHDVVKEIISDPSRLQLGGAKRHMTAIFTDVKGFSTISEALGDPTKLVSLLNKYLSAMSDVVLEEKGTIDKYEGDAIIAFFGAPNELPDHALRACVSAITMKKIEMELNKEIMEHSLSPIPLYTRIGINTGDMVAGNMGTANKMNYTIMGNAVNLAARLEGVNKQYGTWILASEDTVRQTGDSLLYRKLDRVRVVGINEPVRLCELVDMADTASEQDKKLVKVFHEALENFEKRNWDEAAKGFHEALSIKPDDTPSIIYIDRLKQFSLTPPDDSWDGVYNLTSK
ncbi:MAG: CHASE2 domain-containing protein [Treponema sp.]|nr:CHASE2 domain-containing protein [Treponema sp.]MCL2237891.1 CHASE2 domain-containing protein [Treponema sp.]